VSKLNLLCSFVCLLVGLSIKNLNVFVYLTYVIERNDTKQILNNENSRRFFLRLLLLLVHLILLQDAPRITNVLLLWLVVCAFLSRERE
jgi:hypothetical protein